MAWLQQGIIPNLMTPSIVCTMESQSSDHGVMQKGSAEGAQLLVSDYQPQIYGNIPTDTSDDTCRLMFIVSYYTVRIWSRRKDPSCTSEIRQIEAELDPWSFSPTVQIRQQSLRDIAYRYPLFKNPTAHERERTHRHTDLSPGLAKSSPHAFIFNV